MSDEARVEAICAKYGNERTRMMDIVREVQEAFGCVSDGNLDVIARMTGVHRVEVESVVTFYAFLSEAPKGPVTIRLCNDVVDEMFGAERVGQALTEALGIGFGETTPDGAITLEYAPCIGLCDQAPAALVNDVPVTYLSGDGAREMVKTLRETGDPRKLVHRLGDGNNSNPLVRSMVHNNIRRKGEVVFADLDRGVALRKALAMSPVEVIKEMKTSRLRGRGGAGFPAGMKWEFTRAADGARKMVICNADEGEPGTFKDRVILTEQADKVFEGMTIAGYAIGAAAGILYLRAEYAYLRPYLEQVLQERREEGLLGLNVGGKTGFGFDIRIQMGAGAYVCGEETALISSCEGLRGDPKNRPPFPAQKGYLERPTSVNNVETFCCVAHIIDKGAAWFAGMGSKGSAGTKVLSISGDCNSPGVYEFPFGVKLSEVLEACGAEDVQAVQMGGPSGRLVPPAEFDKIVCYDVLATGGAMVVFNKQRNLLDVVARYMDFFVEESCGYCTPCRVGNTLLKEKMEDLLAGKGSPDDPAYLQRLGETVKLTSRCGLGQTSPNPVLTSLKAFPELYAQCVKKTDDAFLPSFDIQAALKTAESLQGRASELFA